LTKFLTKRVILLGILAISCAAALYYQTKANNIHQTVFAAKSTFYMPGQNNNCKWVIHISDRITTFPGDTSSAQIGIPEVIKDGYISGILQNGPGNSLLLAFKAPSQSDNTPPIVLTAMYNMEDLPLKKIRFRVFNSTVMTMVLYSTFESCVEDTMK
jgi:hypothetical protein